jgi:hypothetical protein
VILIVCYLLSNQIKPTQIQNPKSKIQLRHCARYPQVFEMTAPPWLAKASTNMSALIANTTAPGFVSLGGMSTRLSKVPVMHFAKSAAWGADLYEDFVAPYVAVVTHLSHSPSPTTPPILTLIPPPPHHFSLAFGESLTHQNTRLAGHTRWALCGRRGVGTLTQSRRTAIRMAFIPTTLSMCCTSSSETVASACAALLFTQLDLALGACSPSPPRAPSGCCWSTVTRHCLS